MWSTAPDLRIEEGESADLGPCSDCANHALAVWGYVSKNNNAHAAYYACFTKGHLDRGVQILLGVGKWGEGTSSSMRKMIGVQCRMGSDRPAFMVVDASKVELDDDHILGEGLTREQTLSDPLKDEFFRLLDHITANDSRIKNFLQAR